MPTSPCHCALEHNKNLSELAHIDRVDVADMKHMGGLLGYHGRFTGSSLAPAACALSISGVFGQNTEWS